MCMADCSGIGEPDASKRRIFMARRIGEPDACIGEPDASLEDAMVASEVVEPRKKADGRQLVYVLYGLCYYKQPNTLEQD